MLGKFVGHVSNTPNVFFREKEEQLHYDQEYNADEYTWLGHSSIANLGHDLQPLSDSKGRYIIVFNGKIYNSFELKKELEETGVTFYTGEDAEVLLELYAFEKEKVVNRLHGMFSFAIWDKQEKKLVAARDPFGIKPFYLRETEKGIAFASERNDLLPTETLSSQALQNYLTFQYVPGENSLLKGVQQLKPGHFMIKEPGKTPLIQEYYRLDFKIDSNKSLETSVQQTQDVLMSAVQRHMRSEFPIGAYLSGGIDSTSIVALAKQYNPSMKTFTVGFEREGFSEIDQARETADKLGVENIQKVITPEEVVQELPTIIRHMDDPIADPAAIPNYFAGREASKHVNTVLSGEGADELFGGYTIYREHLSLKPFGYLPRFLKRALYHLSRLFPEGMKGKSFLERGTTSLSDRYVGNAKIFNEKEKKALLLNYNYKFSFTSITKSLFQEVSHLHPTTQMQYIDLHTWLSGDILPVADRMAMAHSLELRTPFLDKDVFQVARTLPSHVKIAQGTTKYVLRRAMKDFVPETVFHQRKLGFPVPMRHWLRNELYEWAKDVIHNSPTENLFNKREIWRLLEQHVQKKHDYSRELWTILTFMIWYETHTDVSNIKSYNSSSGQDHPRSRKKDEEKVYAYH